MHEYGQRFGKVWMTNVIRFYLSLYFVYCRLCMILFFAIVICFSKDIGCAVVMALSLLFLVHCLHGVYVVLVVIVIGIDGLKLRLAQSASQPASLNRYLSNRISYMFVCDSWQTDTKGRNIDQSLCVREWYRDCLQNAILLLLMLLLLVVVVVFSIAAKISLIRECVVCQLFIHFISIVSFWLCV